MENQEPVIRKTSKRLNLDEALIQMEVLPSDYNSALTDDESDSEVDDVDPEFVLPEPTGAPSQPAGRLDFDADVSSDESGDEGSQPAATTSKCRGTDKVWKAIPKAQLEDTFTEHEGPKVSEFSKIEQPLDVFMTFMGSSLDNIILEQTNLYKNQLQRNEIATIQRTEMLGFLGINILMGYHCLPSWVHYWKQAPDLNVRLVSDAMTKNRFGQILSCLHINDNLAVPAGNVDKLYKLRPLIQDLNHQFVKLYDVNKVQSIDESMILFKGRSSLKQYNPMKPIKRGYKLWMRADMNGYVSKFEVYQGKNGRSERDGFGLGESVVISMCEDLFGKGHEVYFDNYFSSLTLMDHLFDNGVNACGTIRGNRKGLPDFVRDKTLTRGDSDIRVSTDGKTVVMKWMDNKAVTAVSNFHGTQEGTVKRTQKDGTELTVKCPVAIVDYNKQMGGVDKADMLCAIYGIGRKSKKWWHRIFFGLLDRTIVNSFVCFKILNSSPMSLLNFRRELCQSLIILSYPPKVGRPLSTPCPSPVPAKKRKTLNFSVPESIRMQNVGAHHIVFVDKRGRCEVCTSNKIESRPESKCSLCNVFLCCNKKKNCFNQFHGV